MFSDIVPILIVLGFASSKYVVALGVIFYYDFNFVESTLLATIGGMLGVIFFSYCSDYLKQIWHRFFPKKRNDGIVINARKRFIVKLKQKYGLAGIAFLTPLILTVPLGSALATSLYKNKKRVFTYMFLAFSFWSSLICSLYHFVGVDFGSMLHF